MTIATIILGIAIGLNTAGQDATMHPDGPTIHVSDDVAGVTYLSERPGPDYQCITGLFLDSEGTGAIITDTICNVRD